MLSRKELQRYSRQIMLPQVGEVGQQKLSAARVMVVGLGGLGSPVALYLAAAGVGELHLVDGDKVEVSNLQRQILYKVNHREKPKAEVAARQLTAANPEIRVHAHPHMANQNWLRKRVAEMDLLLDCTDNLETRYSINQVCREVGRPVVMASVRGFSGQLISFDFSTSRSPCYACLFPPRQQREPLNCAGAGVIGPALGVIGSMQALEALKLLLGLPVASLARLHLFEAETLELRPLQVQGNNDCPVCGQNQRS
ncbi:HesA/MoeB/ThiF family protein [Microbulbifer thermotolerans]|uniref:HesA/MoeB/ThiF family protein n=1 Tax=Microbulbifer thermotolerans TaxID=252514 RepID=A0AB35I0N5_MICTH|nr:HesA/MoeB/ThiF family protein [Microbulbifer thermotolerans]MCX2781172.1 HesA/MoeB/ThiF family protein [Microbulbifer thermotolerans]MCX2784461.1 HesA/MoeB/ThiF family protein [Microbulbifer thermotolerans]MCX2796328.1 HesA/MoeB/ThiF family protein [Microbulbifer thermotolerans]MCX2803145.1 HesA/MoeB/ThiF family protein [Microbulbifer thermotolerans]MCX2806565.1 HesA/MoeB/ThiF family protein [Microbulbifer thermotolerans]